MGSSAITNAGAKLTSLTATADLSDKAINQYRAIKGDTANDNQGVVAGAGEAGIGVLQNDPAVGESMELISQGQTPVRLGGTVTRFQQITPDASGDFVLAATGDVVWGVVQEGGAVNEQVTAILGAVNRNLAL